MTATSLMRFEEPTREASVPMDTLGFQRYLWKVSRSHCLSLIRLAYYKMAENLGPEYEKDEGQLILCVLPIQTDVPLI